MKASMKLEGLKDLERKLVKDLPAAASKKAMQGAIGFALTPIQKAARAKVARLTGDLADAIKKRTVINRGSGFQAVGGIYMATRKKQAGWRWHFLEFGTRGHTVKPGKKKKALASGGEIFGREVHIPAQPARPFLRPAWDEEKDNAMRRFRDKLAKNIDKATRKK